MFLGLYFAEDYLRDTLSVSYFGEAVDVYLHAKDGRVIARSGGESYGNDLFEILTESGMLGVETAKIARTAFVEGGETSLLCGRDSKIDNLCMIDLPGYDYVLVQAFPANITQAMVKRGEYGGRVAENLSPCPVCDLYSFSADTCQKTQKAS